MEVALILRLLIYNKYRKLTIYILDFITKSI